MKKPLLRRAQRGAVFVEAIVVISFFTLCFLGVVYFRELYLAKMRVRQLARASAMAHAMSACKGDPRAGLEQDLPRAPEQRTERGSGKAFEIVLPGGGVIIEGANKVLDEIVTAAGGSLNRVTVVKLTATASATTQKDPLSPKEGFESDVSSESFVSCMDPVSDKQFEEILPHMKDAFESFF